MKFVHVLILGWACALPLAASAQWQWIDNTGKKVFSDQPPPLDVPEKNILRRAAGASQRASVAPAPGAATAPDAAAPGAAPAAGVPKPTGVDKELAEKTRKAEEVEKAKQAAEAQKVAQAKADNCTRAKQGKATFDSGIRVARVNAQGEREIMDDKARAAEAQRVQAVIDSDCK
ncbi:DUF4124 domain-containing protein [Variovorax sp. RT4R15]|uniref:DUF4124 domain-containing protein n=1 Tax=Variovorax sp. RT4R15 TaxID=3443737 RepID=UPI003F48AC8B